MRDFTLTEDEITYLQACAQDSSDEGNFNPLFDLINPDVCLGGLIRKGLIKGVWEDGLPYVKTPSIPMAEESDLKSE